MSSRFFVGFPKFQVFPGIFVHQSLLFAKAFLFVLTAALDNLIAKLKGESGDLYQDCFIAFRLFLVYRGPSRELKYSLLNTAIIVFSFGHNINFHHATITKR